MTFRNLVGYNEKNSACINLSPHSGPAAPPHFANTVACKPTNNNVGSFFASPNISPALRKNKQLSMLLLCFLWAKKQHLILDFACGSVARGGSDLWKSPLAATLFITYFNWISEHMLEFYYKDVLFLWWKWQRMNLAQSTTKNHINITALNSISVIQGVISEWINHKADFALTS